jgi:hypothetical protein
MRDTARPRAILAAHAPSCLGCGADGPQAFTTTGCHGRRLRRLTGLVAPVLDDVLFEAVPDVESDDDDADPDPLRDADRLRAFLPECTFEIVADAAATSGRAYEHAALDAIQARRR